MTKRKKDKSKRTSTLLILLMLVGIGFILYPAVSNGWNSLHASRAIAAYSSDVENMDDEQCSRLLEDACRYNRKIPEKTDPYMMTEEDLEEYRALLDLSGTGIMGYINIPTIGVHIPIYHGMDESVLQIAIGHLDWSSLPVGGEGTHAVLTGHRGLPSARLFTDLDQLREGDIFRITVLKQTLSYEVDQIRIVEPDDVSELKIIPGKDYCTLVTCTPYGINTQRMLVRGHRIVEDESTFRIPADARRVSTAITIPAIGLPMMMVTLICMLLHNRRKKPRIRPADLHQIAEQDLAAKQTQKRRKH